MYTQAAFIYSPPNLFSAHPNMASTMVHPSTIPLKITFSHVHQMVSIVRTPVDSFVGASVPVYSPGVLASSIEGPSEHLLMALLLLISVCWNIFGSSPTPFPFSVHTASDPQTSETSHIPNILRFTLLSASLLSRLTFQSCVISST